MPVAASDMKVLLSGDSGNTDPNASLGGGRSSTEVIFSPTLNNLFDNVTPDQLSAGDTEYRCVYVQNDHATDTLDAVKVWISSNTPSSGTTIEIGLDPAGKNGLATGPVSPSSAAPGGVTFSAPSTSGAGLSLGTMDAQDVYPLWVKRTVNAATGSASSDPFTLGFTGTPA